MAVAVAVGRFPSAVTELKGEASRREGCREALPQAASFVSSQAGMWQVQNYPAQQTRQYLPLRTGVWAKEHPG